MLNKLQGDIKQEKHENKLFVSERLDNLEAMSPQKIVNEPKASYFWGERLKDFSTDERETLQSLEQMYANAWVNPSASDYARIRKKIYESVHKDKLSTTAGKILLERSRQMIMRFVSKLGQPVYIARLLADFEYSVALSANQVDKTCEELGLTFEEYRDGADTTGQRYKTTLEKFRAAQKEQQPTIDFAEVSTTTPAERLQRLLGLKK